jgi:hypothetical protein
MEAVKYVICYALDWGQYPQNFRSFTVPTHHHSTKDGV